MQNVSKKERTLLAGPWIGEFGWELFAWHGYVRALSKKFDKTIVISRSNSKALYVDFANDFYDYTPPDELADSFFMYNIDLKSCLKEAVQLHNIDINKDMTLLLPRRIGMPPHTHHAEAMSFGEYVITPEYIRFGAKKEQEYDYIFHIRSRELRKEDNWSIENWEKLKALLGDKRIACVGTKEEAGWIEGTDDLRSIDLQSLLTLMTNATCTFGSSSGPMHLSSLCSSPHVVWSIPQNRIRYENNWNPLNAPILFLDKYSWHPSAEYVYNKYVNWSIHKNE
tara:strand:- start:473 stop:1315 length:843 start_codon:yes stop_codon:yes gene_type:complete